MSLVGDGDAGAFAGLYDRHSRAAYSLAYRMMGKRQAAEDLVQDAFLEVWRASGSYRAERGSVRTCVLVQKYTPSGAALPRRAERGSL